MKGVSFSLEFTYWFEDFPLLDQSFHQSVKEPDQCMVACSKSCAVSDELKTQTSWVTSGNLPSSKLYNRVVSLVCYYGYGTISTRQSISAANTSIK